MTDALEPADRDAEVGLSMPKLMELALKSDRVDALERLVALEERMSARLAAREYAEAMARFQAACPPVQKSSTATVVTKAGSRYQYQYAELDEIARTVRPHLHKEGLSYHWDNVVSEDGKRITVKCIVSHINGHRGEACFAAPTAALTSSMSPQQEVAAALTFGKRQSLISVLGLTTTDEDVDGAAQDPGLAGYITPEQVLELEALLGQRPDGSRARFLRYYQVEHMEEIPADRFASIKAELERKIKGGNQ